MSNIDRHPRCHMRTSLGNCDPLGGFCTSVNEPICEALHKASRSQEWIPCSERLPEKGQAVLISDEFGVKYGWQYGGHWSTYVSYGRVDVEPVAWLPLPEPYEDGGEK